MNLEVGHLICFGEGRLAGEIPNFLEQFEKFEQSGI